MSNQEFSLQMCVKVKVVFHLYEPPEIFVDHILQESCCTRVFVRVSYTMLDDRFPASRFRRGYDNVYHTLTCWNR
jgi:hypothetical protein